MKRICAWCKKELSPREGYAAEGAISHGICSMCALEITRDMPRTAASLLDLIDEPLFVVDGEGRVQSANRSGRDMVGKDLPRIKDHLGGDVFECVHSKEPGGCGQTEHCTVCTIRNTVMDTLTTGKEQTGVTAIQEIAGPDGPQEMKFRISTERVGERILLRIDSVG